MGLRNEDETNGGCGNIDGLMINTHHEGNRWLTSFTGRAEGSMQQMCKDALSQANLIQALLGTRLHNISHFHLGMPTAIVIALQEFAIHLCCDR